MDGMYREGRYQQLIEKLNRIQSSDYPDDAPNKYEVLQVEVNSIIESLRHRGDQSNAKIHYVLLIVPLVIVLIVQSVIEKEYLENALLLFGIGIILLIIRFRTNLTIKKSHQAHQSSGGLPNDSKNFILTKLTYLEYAMDIKKTRLVLAALFYMIFFPVLLVKLHLITFVNEPFDSLGIAYLIAYLLGAALWYFYYNRAFELYDGIEEEIELIRNNL